MKAKRKSSRWNNVEDSHQEYNSRHDHWYHNDQNNFDRHHHKRKYGEDESQRKRFSRDVSYNEGQHHQESWEGGYDDHCGQHHYPPSQPHDAESSWMDKYLIAWQELISNKEYYIRRDLSKQRASNLSNTSGQDDLGAMFNEPRLNSLIRDDGTGDTRPLYTCDLSTGNATFLCTICNVSACGVKGMQSHMNGRKHREKASNFQIQG